LEPYSPDGRGKAVADGAAAWYIRRSVTGRAARFAYGTTIRLKYDPSNPTHVGRTVRHDVDGDFVNGFWSEIVKKVSPMIFLLDVYLDSETGSHLWHQ
jgi:hypothetical protein